MSKAIGSKASQPLVMVERDRQTKDGGKPGELTSNPQDIDAIVKRTWQAIHKGIGGVVGKAIETYLHNYTRYITMRKTFEAPAITGQRVYEAFGKTEDSAGALDGWQPKEMSLLALEVCEEIATMLNQIEEGAEWPKSAMHARVVFLEKEGAPVGKITSYRPLTITAPIYRCYATMRLEDMHEWVQHWALDEMHAGIPGKGAVDAWHTALTNIEELKLDGKGYCGAVADIMKFFDQIRRQLVYRIAKAAGMPDKVLRAYRAYLEGMKVYNCLAGGVGTPYWRGCGIPQGCPFSMMIVALIMRPWIVIMQGITDVKAYILADDVLVIATGINMVENLAKAIDQTHSYLHSMGGNVAPTRATTLQAQQLPDNGLQTRGGKGSVTR